METPLVWAMGCKESPCVDVQLTTSRVDFTDHLPPHLYTLNTHTHKHTPIEKKSSASGLYLKQPMRWYMVGTY